MGIFDELKKKAEQLASDVSKIADNTLKDASAWTEQVVKDTKSWTQHTIEDTKEWTEKATKDAKEWTEQAAKDTAEWTSGKWEEMGKYAEDFQKWKKELPDKLHEFKDNFSIEDFWNKIKDTALNAGQEVVFMALTIYYSIANQFKSDDLQSPNKQQKK